MFSVQQATAPVSTDTSLAVLFDGRPMIDAGIPETVRSLQEEGAIGPLTTVYVESIEGSTTRGPSRVASLTDPVLLDRLVDTLRGFLEQSGAVTADSRRRVVLGHSLGGNAALYVAAHWPRLFGGAATGSAALWWPGDPVQLSGSQVAAEVQAATGLRLWMQAGTAEDPDLLRSNREFWEGADAASLDLVHVEHSGGHELSAWRSGLGQALPHLLREPG
ncbi:alpha/beta hydrolase-fold protein [Terrabacter sp. Ter38]|uniref:alpha/beta hydrolase n=1 Tax=Terrabacter sp. Ter38 TaxID=2926030 RepID=UPI002118AB3D|nr:alpha/beta hydrolase-fold protein [Terrabacter sp. Ter38]